MTPISSGLSLFVRWVPTLAILGAAVWVALSVAKAEPTLSSLANFWWAITATPLAGLLHYLTTWKLVDAVFDCGDHLLIRRGRSTVRLPLTEISGVSLGLHLLGDSRREVIIHAKAQTELGSRVHFLPTLSNLPDSYLRVGIVNHLRLRIERAARNAA